MKFTPVYYCGLICWFIAVVFGIAFRSFVFWAWSMMAFLFLMLCFSLLNWYDLYIEYSRFLKEVKKKLGYTIK